MTIPQTINNGYIASFLAALYNDNQRLMGGALPAPSNPVSIKMVADALYWGWSGNAQTSESLKAVSNYLIYLGSKFFLQASIITGTGGSVGQITPVNLTPVRLDFIVSGSSPIPSGGSSLLITSYIGYQLNFVRNGIPQSTLNTEPSYFSWNTNTGSFNCYPVLNAGELVSLIPS